jgi:hypothetical protein
MELRQSESIKDTDLMAAGRWWLGIRSLLLKPPKS